MKYSKEIFLAVAVIFIVTILFIDTSSDVKHTTEETEFNNWALSVIDAAKADSSYKKIPLDSRADQRWFMEIMFNAWSNKISKSEFIEKGIEKFPDSKKSFEFVAERFPKNKKMLSN